MNKAQERAEDHRDMLLTAQAVTIRDLRSKFAETCGQLSRMQAHLEKTGIAKLGESWVDGVLPRLIAQHNELRAALEASHNHVYPKPGCAACDVLGRHKE